MVNHGNRTVTAVVEIENSYGDNMKIWWDSRERLWKEDSNKYNVTVSVKGEERRFLRWREEYKVI